MCEILLCVKHLVTYISVCMSDSSPTVVSTCVEGACTRAHIPCEKLLYSCKSERLPVAHVSARARTYKNAQTCRVCNCWICRTCKSIRVACDGSMQLDSLSNMSPSSGCAFTNKC